MDDLFTTRLMSTLRSIDNTQHSTFPKHTSTRAAGSSRCPKLRTTERRCIKTTSTATAMTSIAMCILAVIIIILVCVIGYMLLYDGDDDRATDTDRM